MANLQQRLPENVPGDFFVDSTCIDCDTCSQLAPSVFRDHGDQCSVHHQPETADETRLAMMSLVSCPTGSIGAREKHNAHVGIDAFPIITGRERLFLRLHLSSEFWSVELLRYTTSQRRRQLPDRLAAFCSSSGKANRSAGWREPDASDS